MIRRQEDKKNQSCLLYCPIREVFRTIGEKVMTNHVNIENVCIVSHINVLPVFYTINCNCMMFPLIELPCWRKTLPANDVPSVGHAKRKNPVKVFFIALLVVTTSMQTLMQPWTLHSSLFPYLLPQMWWFPTSGRRISVLSFGCEQKSLRPAVLHQVRMKPRLL